MSGIRTKVLLPEAWSSAMTSTKPLSDVSSARHAASFRTEKVCSTFLIAWSFGWDTWSIERGTGLNLMPGSWMKWDQSFCMKLPGGAKRVVSTFTPSAFSKLIASLICWMLWMSASTSSPVLDAAAAITTLPDLGLQHNCQRFTEYPDTRVSCNTLERKMDEEKRPKIKLLHSTWNLSSS